MKEKRKQSIRLCGLLSLLLLLALLGGCKKKENTEAKTDEEGYQIYYLNKDEIATATVNYQPEAKDTDGLIQELLKKLAEESSEVIMACKDNDHDHIRYEAGDLIYHLLVTLERYGITLDELAGELNARRH